MAGVTVGGKSGKRRVLDSEINMIPMIDLLMVTISFLLITAVWVHAQRLEGTTEVPSATGPLPCTDCEEDARLHVETADPAKFVIAWRQGRTVVRTIDVPRESRKVGAITFPSLAAKISEEWRSGGRHRNATDRHFDQAVVHAANDMSYAELIAVMDAVAEPKRPYASATKTTLATAFDVTLATD